MKFEPGAEEAWPAEVAAIREVEGERAALDEEAAVRAQLRRDWLNHAYTRRLGEGVLVELAKAMLLLRAAARKSSDPEVRMAVVHLDHCEETAKEYGKLDS